MSRLFFTVALLLLPLFSTATPGNETEVKNATVTSDDNSIVVDETKNVTAMSANNDDDFDPLSTHILDTTAGVPAAGVLITLSKESEGVFTVVQSR